MNTLFRRSASVAPSASRQTLAFLLRLIPSESFGSSSISQFSHVNGSAPEKKGGAFEIRSRDLHFAAPLRSSGFKASDVARAEFAMDESFFDDEKTSILSKKGEDEEGLEIAKLNIDKRIVQELAKKGITKLFPIQKTCFEPAMQGRDMIGRAKTGTGKTLAFGIPIMDKILRHQDKNGRGRNPLALVLAPTRELAKQVEKEFRESAPLDTLCVYGGMPIQAQMRTLDYGVDVVVGTPGRIIDLIKRGALHLKDVQFVVLDEADQMLAVGFEEAVETILENLPKNRQSLMFSATMPQAIRNLTRKYLKDPVTIDLVSENDKKLAEGITLYSIATEKYTRGAILGPLIKEYAKGGKCIVFTQTKRDADRLSDAMSRSFTCEALHGDISQNQRERTLSGFRDGRFNILIATDVAARGLDIPNVDLVIHYELPNSSELFVHRSGRTGRAGKKGSTILIYSNEESRAVSSIERDVRCKFTELPRITVEAGAEDMFAGIGGGRFDSYGGGRMGGRMGGGPGFSRGGGGYGGGGYGSGGGGFGRYRGGPPSGRAGGYGESGSDRFGSFGTGSSSSGGFGRSAGFGNQGSGRSGGFGNSSNSGFGRSNSFGKSDSNRNSGFGFGNSSADSSWDKF